MILITFIFYIYELFDKYYHKCLLYARCLTTEQLRDLELSPGISEDDLSVALNLSQIRAMEKLSIAQRPGNPVDNCVNRFRSIAGRMTSA